MSTKMDTLLAGQSALERRCEGLEARVDVNSADIKDIKESLNFDSTTLKDNSVEIETMKKQLKEQERELVCSRQLITILDNEMNNLQRYTRGFNIRILGMAEDENEDCVASVDNLLKDYFDISGFPIENAHRIGKRIAGKPRHMIARFHSRATRRSVMAVARDKLAGTTFRITDDLTARDLEAKKRVIPLMNKLYSDNQKPRFVNGRLYSNGKLVPQEAIDAFLSKLPGN